MIASLAAGLRFGRAVLEGWLNLGLLVRHCGLASRQQAISTLSCLVICIYRGAHIHHSSYTSIKWEPELEGRAAKMLRIRSLVMVVCHCALSLGYSLWGGLGVFLVPNVMDVYVYCGVEKKAHAE